MNVQCTCMQNIYYEMLNEQLLAMKKNCRKKKNFLQTQINEKSVTK